MPIDRRCIFKALEGIDLKYEGRLVVDAHIHITTLYKPKGVTKGWEFPEGWTGLGEEL